MPHWKRPRLDDESSNLDDARFLHSLPPEHCTALRLLAEDVSVKPKVPMKYLILQSRLPHNVKQATLRRLERGVDCKYEQWLQRAIELPIGVFAPKPPATEVGALLKLGRSEMDAAICGNYEAKMEILRLLGQWATATTASAPHAIGLEGPPGVGKTTFARAALATTLRRPFCFVSLGGANDGTLIWGHSFTYEGSLPGRIVEELIAAQCMDPVIYFDELDKVSKSARGDEIIHALIHLTDPQQNCEFRDRYMQGIPLDLSRAVFAFSFNDRNAINPILLDRLKIVTCQAPTVDEKMNISRQFLLPHAVSAIGNQDLVTFDDDVLRPLAQRSKEAGVREFNRCLCHIVSTLNVAVHGGPEIVGLTPADVERLPIRCSTNLYERLLPFTADVSAPVIASMYT